MHGFDQQTIGEQVEIERQAVELLCQPVTGDDGARATYLGLAEDKREDRSVEIVLADTESPDFVVDVALHV